MIELLVAFSAGLISFLSPCVLPLIPGYISYISGSSKASVGLTMFVVLIVVVLIVLL